MRTGIYGGNFNPIHNGHIQIALEAVRECDLDELWFMPAWTQPFKIGKPVADGCHRAEMIRLAIEDYDKLKLSTYELDKKGISYTYQTMQHMKEQYPEKELYFLMGADSVFTFDTWKNPEIICSCANIIAAPRHSSNAEEDVEFDERICMLREKFHTGFYPLKMPYIDISSTMVRKMMERIDEMSEKEISDQKMISPKVLSYIREHGLYR